MKRIQILGVLLAILFVLSNITCTFAEDDGDATVETASVQSDDALQDGGLNGSQEKVSSGFLMFTLQQDTMVSLCDRIADAMENYETEVDITGLSLPYDSSTTDDIMTCVLTVLNSNPQYFSYKSGFSYSYTPSSITAVTLAFRDDAATAQTERATYLASVNEALAYALPSTEYDGDSSNDVMSATEKALALHDYLALHNRYNHEALAINDTSERLATYPNVYNAYGALVEKHAVCQGVALAYVSLLKEVGIGCYIVTSDNLNHAWNIVRDENYDWYYVDVTWDDPDFSIDYNNDGDWMGYCGHSNFMMTETELEANHFSEHENDTTVSIVDGTAPQTPAESHAYSAFWDNVKGGMFYCAGYWYYNDGLLYKDSETEQCFTEGSLHKAAYTADAGTGDVIAGHASFPAIYDDRLYYYDYDAYAIERYSTATGNISVAQATGEDGLVSEMAAGGLNLKAYDNGADYMVPEGKLVYILHDSDGQTVNLLDLYMTMGDVSGDGQLSVADVVLLCRSLIGVTTLTGNALEMADYNEDGTVTLADGLALCRAIGG